MESGRRSDGHFGGLWRGLPALALLFAVPARAQSGVDAHGAVPSIGDADATDGIHTWYPERQTPGAFSVGSYLEYDDGLLVRYVVSGEGGEPDRQRLLDDVVGLDLGGMVAVHSRVAVGFSAPLFLSSVGRDGPNGFSTGDVHLWAPIGLVLPGAEGEGFGLSAVPWLDLPTGDAEAGLGDAGVGGGGLLAAGYGAGRVSFAANAGVERRAWADFENLTGGPAARLAAMASFSPSARTGLHLEATAGVPFTRPPANLPQARGSTTPAELIASFRRRELSGLWWTVGGAKGLTTGVGAAAWRAYVGVGFARVRDEVTLTPVGQAPTTMRVTDPRGAPITGAAVEVGRKPAGVTGADGSLVLDGQPWRRGVRVVADGYEPADVAEPAPGAADVTVVLSWAPVPGRVVVRDQAGAPVAATLTLRAADGATTQPAIGADGQATLALRPGTYELTVGAAGLGTQTRTIVVEEGRKKPVAVEVILAPDEGDGAVEIVLTDAEGKPLDGARVLVDGRPVGTAASGGTLTVGDLREGPHRVEIGAEGFRTVEKTDVTVTGTAAVSLPVALEREPGSVKVVVRGPQGRVVDAVARFEGPSRLSPTPLGEYGERTFVLRPGTWKVVVLSPTYGIQQREVVVPEDEFGLITVEIVLQPAEAGDADLAVRVVDVDGNPVDAAQVLVDGKPYGQTSTGGALALEDLLPGPRRVEIRAEHFRDTAATELLLVEGLQERVFTLAYEPGTVRVTARGAEGPVRDAAARFSGPATAPSLPLGATGVAYTTLPDGAWSVVVLSPTHGLQQRRITVPPDSRSLIAVDVVMSPPEGGSADLVVSVVDPESKPVVGAAVSLDGTPLGATSTGGDLRVDDLDTGTRRLDVAAEPFRPKTVSSLRLREGETPVQVQLDWGPGAVRVVATGPNGPVSDALVRFAGPSVLPPRPVDGNGQRLFALSPGKWTAVVASPSHGLAQREVEIREDTTGLTTVEVALTPVGAGLAELLVRVQDEDGQPVPGASVKLGAATGATSSGGALVLSDLEPGEVSLEVTAPHFRPVQVAGVELAEGAQERIVTLAWVPQPVTVTVRDKDGRPTDAEVRFDGPADVPPARVGADGTETLSIRPGRWQVLASTDALGMGRREIVVEPGKTAAVELTLLPAKVDVTAAQVVIREQVNFDFNKADVRPESAAVLDEVANTLLARPEIRRVEVQGHTDDVGDVAYNFELSVQRAQAVMAALVARGVAPERLVAQGYGATRPIGDSSDAGRARNRRVQFEITEYAATEAP